MRNADKEYLARHLAAGGWKYLVPLYGPALWSFPPEALIVEFNQAEMDFIDKTVKLSTAAISFEDIRRLFYAMVAGEEVAL